MNDRPNLILYTASNSARTIEILRNAEHIKGLPIDGMVINVPQSYFAMSAPGAAPEGAEVTRAALEPWLEPLADFNEGMHNYLITFIDRPGDLFDDAVWAQVAENFRLMAEGAREAGFKGMIFDNEEYFGAWDNFPEDWPGADPADLTAYQAQAALRGRQIMEAIAEAFPEAEVGVTHGPYTSVEGGADEPPTIEAQAGGAALQELRGPFFTGMLEGKGPGQTLIDMGELYGARTAPEYAASQAYRSDRVPELIDWDVAPALLDGWDSEVVIDHMVSTDQFPTDGVTPETLEIALEGAFAHSEENVFLYSTVGTSFNEENLDWFVPGLVRAEWTDAIADAIADFEAGETAPDPGPQPPAANGNDVLVGGTAADFLRGEGGDDEIYGNGGDDWLEGGAGADIVAGGTGWDWSSYELSSSAVRVDLLADAASGGHATGDTLIGIENLRGSAFADRLTGDDGVGWLDGGAGNDVLVGNWGADRLKGGSGSDRLSGGGDGDTFVFADVQGAGRDVVTDFDGTLGDRLLFEGLAGGRDDLSITGRGDDLEIAASFQTVVLEGAAQGFDVDWIAFV